MAVSSAAVAGAVDQAVGGVLAVVLDVSCVVGFECRAVEVLRGVFVERLAAEGAGASVHKVVHESGPVAPVIPPVPRFVCLLLPQLLACLLLVPACGDGVHVSGSFVLDAVHDDVFAWVDYMDLSTLTPVAVDGGLRGCGVDDPHVCVCGVLLGLTDRCVACCPGDLLHRGGVLVVRGGEAGEGVGELVVVDGDVAGLSVLPDVGGLPCGG